MRMIFALSLLATLTSIAFADEPDVDAIESQHLANILLSVRNVTHGILLPWPADTFPGQLIKLSGAALA